MSRLKNIDTVDLYEALKRIDSSSATLRIVVGLNYKHDVSQTEMAEWYGVSRSTIHNWLTDLEQLNDAPLEDVVCDGYRSGRPHKLSTEKQRCLKRTLASSPISIGYDATQWSPELLQLYIDEKFDVHYSKRHARTLLSQLDPNQNQSD